MEAEVEMIERRGPSTGNEWLAYEVIDPNLHWDYGKWVLNRTANDKMFDYRIVKYARKEDGPTASTGG